MKKSQNGKAQRVLTVCCLVLVGLVLVVLGGCVVAEAVFGAPISSALGTMLGSRAPVAVVCQVLLTVVLLCLGVFCWLLPVQRRASNQNGFIMQKSENGAIGISVKAIEGLVSSCIDQHENISEAEISLEEHHDGIGIVIEAELAAGLNIPLAVGALQKQIRQYVTACTGVDVQEVRVMVEDSDEPLINSPYAVQNLAPTVESLPQPERAEPLRVEAAEGEAPVEASAVQPATPAPPVMPMPPVPETTDARPLHQRLFGTEDQPAIVPAPPELAEKEEEKKQQEELAQAEEVENEENQDTDEMERTEE